MITKLEKVIKVIGIFILIVLSNNIYSQDNCTNALNLALQTSPISSTTVGRANDFSFCLMGSSPDVIAYYDLPHGSTITIQQTTNNYDSRHTLRYGGACPGTIEIVCTDDPDLQVETWKNCTGVTQRVYYILAGYSTNFGTFTLAWSVTAGTCPIGGHNIGTGNLNACSGTLYDAGGSSSSYSNNESFTETYCSNSSNCIQVVFNSFSTESCCDRLRIYDGPTTGSPLIGTYQGTISPGTITSTTGCLTFEWSSDGSNTSTGWDATISCVACPTCFDGIKNGLEVGIDCGGPTCPACPCGSLPIINDEACCATPVPVNTGTTCTLTTPGTVANATPSFNANTCGGTDDDDVWFSFVATSTQHDISLLNVAGSTTDLYHAVYAGTCNSTGVALVCSDPNNSSVAGLTPGNTYYIRVYTYTSTGGQNTTFDVCITSPCGNYGVPTCGLNYSYSSIAHAPVSYSNGSIITFTDDRYASTYTALPFPFCFDGVIYNDILVSSNGYIVFPGCNSGHPFGTTPTLNGSSPWSINAPAPNTTNAPVNAIMGTWQDIYPDNTDPLQGVIRTRVHGSAPNQFFVIKFFDVRYFSCTTLDYNGQIMLYETTDNIEVHLKEKPVCTTFNGGAAIMGITDYTGTLANIPAGYNYPTQWTATNEGHRWTSNCGVCTVLPVELIDFNGSDYDNHNLITWKTETEINNDYFVLERSNGGATFYELATIKGGGNSNNILDYSFQHNNPQEIEYYRLRQVDFDGKVAYSKIIVVRRKNNINVNLFPNPTNNNLYFEINESTDATYTVKYSTITGSIAEEQISITKGTNKYNLELFKTLQQGIYFINVTDEKGNTIKIDKIIKN
jgi:hypothetical protein